MGTWVREPGHSTYLSPHATTKRASGSLACILVRFALLLPKVCASSHAGFYSDRHLFRFGNYADIEVKDILSIETDMFWLYAFSWWGATRINYRSEGGTRCFYIGGGIQDYADLVDLLSATDQSGAISSARDTHVPKRQPATKQSIPSCFTWSERWRTYVSLQLAFPSVALLILATVGYLQIGHMAALALPMGAICLIALWVGFFLSRVPVSVEFLDEAFLVRYATGRRVRLSRADRISIDVGRKVLGAYPGGIAVRPADGKELLLPPFFDDYPELIHRLRALAE
jgi:hypothetical protein